MPNSTQPVFRAPSVILDNPITWEDLHQCTLNKSFNKLGRSKPIFEDYRDTVVKVRKLYKTLPDYIWATKFGIKTSIDQTTGQYYVDEDVIKEIRKGHSLKPFICRNDFPYYCTPDITHYVLWSTKTLTTQEADSIICQYFKDVKQENIIRFVQNPDIQTIPEITHWHVFIRDIDESN